MAEHTGLRNVLKGWLTCAVLALTGPLGAQEPFDYFRNSWSVIGLKDYAHATRVTPANELLVRGADAKDAKVSIRYGRQLTPLSRTQTKQLLDGWLPVILVTAQDESVRYEFTLWATPLPSVKDWPKAFDQPSEGENFLNWIRAKVTNTGAKAADAKLKVEKDGAPESRSGAFAWSVPPGASVEAVVRIPFSPVGVDSDFAGEEAALWLDRTVRYWRGVMAQGAQIEVPCPKATEAYLASHVCQLIAADHGELHPGEHFYDEFYLRDAAYQVMELEEAGLSDAARVAVASFLSRQRPDGRFESQKGQLDANGQTCWALWQYYKITGDRQWLTTVYPQMRRAVDWTIQERRKAPADSPFSGVLPNAVADGEYLWDGKHRIVGYDLWNLRGLLCAADAARLLGRIEEAQELTHEADLYRKAIDAVWQKTGLAHFPPSWEKKGTHWGNTETLWPTELFDRSDQRVAALIQNVRQDHGGGFIEGTMPWLGHADAIHPYMSAYTTMASLLRGEHEQVVEDFYWYLLHSTATHAFPEGIYYKQRIAWNDTIPHALGASNYALMLRHMLLHERDDELHLLMAVPDWWLAEGKVIRIERAPTHFGPLSLRVAGTARGVEVTLDPHWRQPPKRILLHLPRSRPLLKPVAGVDVVVRSDQQRRWDFPAVVRLYQDRAASVSALDAGRNWPSFRGSSASGVAEGSKVPSQWSMNPSQNILWKTPIPGLGHSSPVVWENRVFVTTALQDQGESDLKVGMYGDVQSAAEKGLFSWHLYCVDRSSGNILWDRQAYAGRPKIKRHPKSSHANATPCTNGRCVVAFFGSEGLYCYDMEGKLLWQKDLGLLDWGFYRSPAAQWAGGCSPVLHDQMVILQCDVQKDSFLAAFALKDGSLLWKTPRADVPTWSTPTVYAEKQDPQIIVNGYKHIGGYDLQTGKEIWRMAGGGDIPVPTPIVAHGLIYITSAHGGPSPIYAIRVSARGDISLPKGETSNEHIAWSYAKGGNYIPTPLVHGDYLYCGSDRGTLSCFECETGKQVYREPLNPQGAAFSSSPVAADGRVYFTAENGDVYVVQAGPEFKLLGINKMDETCMATPAISQGTLFFRTQHHLVAVAERRPSE